MVEVTVIVPAKDNAGVSLARERKAIEQDVLTLCGGYTRDKVSGAWLGDDGRCYHDESYRYTLACTVEVARLVASKASEWCSVLRQECLYLSERAVQVEFVKPVKVAAVSKVA